MIPEIIIPKVTWTSEEFIPRKKSELLLKSCLVCPQTIRDKQPSAENIPFSCITNSQVLTKSSQQLFSHQILRHDEIMRILLHLIYSDWHHFQKIDKHHIPVLHQEIS